jgi:hypothetical protein
MNAHRFDSSWFTRATTALAGRLSHAPVGSTVRALAGCLPIFSLIAALALSTGCGASDEPDASWDVAIEDGGASLDPTYEANLAAALLAASGATEQAIIAVNALLYLDFSKTDYAEFDTRRTAADAAVALMETKGADLEALTDQYTATVTGALSRTQAALNPDWGPADNDSPIRAQHSAPETVPAIQKLATAVGKDAAQMKAGLQQLKDLDEARYQQNIDAVADAAEKAAIAIRSGCTFALFVGSVILTGGAAAAPGAGLGAGMTAVATITIGGPAVAISTLDDALQILGKDEKGPLSDQVPLFGTLDKVLSIVTLRGSALAEKTLTLLTFAADKIKDGQYSVSLNGSGTAQVKHYESDPPSRACKLQPLTFAPRADEAGSPASAAVSGALTPISSALACMPDGAPPFPAGNYRDFDNDDAVFTSSGLPKGLGQQLQDSLDAGEIVIVIEAGGDDDDNNTGGGPRCQALAAMCATCDSSVTTSMCNQYVTKGVEQDCSIMITNLRRHCEATADLTGG